MLAEEAKKRQGTRTDLKTSPPIGGEVDDKGRAAAVAARALGIGSSSVESRDWEADLWLLVTPTMRRADSVQPRLRATSAQAILKNVGGRFAAWQNLSTD